MQHTAGRRPGSGQPEKETPAAYSSVGRGAALLGEGGGTCVSLLVRASISILDELSCKQEMKRQRDRVTGYQKVCCHYSVHSPSHKR